MPIPDATPFSPPSARQVDEFLARNELRPPSFASTWLPAIVMLFIIGLASTAEEPWVVVPLWICLITMMVGMGLRSQWQRAIDGRVTELQQLAMLRHFTPALRLAWRTLPSVRTFPELHGRTVLMMAHCLDHLRQPEAALIAYDRVIKHLPAELAITTQLQIQQTINQLAADHLLDADRAIRKLRSRAGEHPHSPISASYRLACLVQQVRTQHFADAVADSQNLVEELRPLGVESGYGHALLAFAHEQLAGRVSPEALAEPDRLAHHASEARLCWERATLLLQPEAIADRFPQLAPLAKNRGQPHALSAILLPSPKPQSPPLAV
jgi:hypothetical protein